MRKLAPLHALPHFQNLLSPVVVLSTISSYCHVIMLKYLPLFLGFQKYFQLGLFGVKQGGGKATARSVALERPFLPTRGIRSGKIETGFGKMKVVKSFHFIGLSCGICMVSWIKAFKSSYSVIMSDFPSSASRKLCFGGRQETTFQMLPVPTVFCVRVKATLVCTHVARKVYMAQMNALRFS